MTVRAILLGLLMAAALAAVGYVNDIWRSFPSIGGNLMPSYAFGLLMLGVLVVNPLGRQIGRVCSRLGLGRCQGCRFSSAELVVMLACVLMGSVIAGSGLMWVFPHPIITPLHHQAIDPGWRDRDLLQYVPAVMMVDAEPGSDAVIDYMQGLSRPGSPLPISGVPWGKWRATLAFWFAVLGLNFIAGLAAVIVVHRQWSQREHLAYPIATITNELLEPSPEGGAFNAIFRNRLFWLGFAVAFGVLSVNGIHAWHPGFVSIPLELNLYSLREILPSVGKVPWVNVLRPRFYFAAVGLAYFLTSEASFSLGLSGWLYVAVAAPLVVAGVDLQTDVLAGGLPAYMYFGAYVGLAVMVVYCGRHFYWAVARRAVGLGRSVAGEVLPREVTAFRVLIGSGAALTGLLWWVGLHPLLAVAFVALTGMLFLMVGRINVATGLFIIQPFWHPVGVLAAALGSFAIGPHALIILALLCVVTTIDPRIAVVPLALNVVRMGELRRLGPGRLAGWMGAAVILAMVVAVPVTVYILYSYGVSGTDSPGQRWAVDQVSKRPFQMLQRAVDKLAATGRLDEASEPTHLGRLLAPEPKKYFWTAAGIGFVLVMLCSYLRLRFARWPLHPMLFLVWGSRWTTEFAPSFLLAWLIKTQVMHYGGQSTYRRARPLFIGLMAGEFVAAVFWGGIGYGYYLLTGTVGPAFSVRP